MLAECILHFDVVNAVGQRLGLVLSKEAVKQAETDAYVLPSLPSLPSLAFCPFPSLPFHSPCLPLS
eukprot:3821493-Prymnesium_polylepis.1